jgi:hypothetical protein
MALVRMVLVTRARTFPDNALALVAIKVHKATPDAGWPPNAIDQVAHGIPYGPQVTFLLGLTSMALRLQLAAPVIINSTTDATRSCPGETPRESGEALYTKPESAVIQSRRFGTEVAIAGRSSHRSAHSCSRTSTSALLCCSPGLDLRPHIVCGGHSRHRRRSHRPSGGPARMPQRPGRDNKIQALRLRGAPTPLPSWTTPHA